MSPARAEGRSVASRIAFSTLAFPDATLAAAVSAGRRWGYSGVELRLIDGELVDPAMLPARRAGQADPGHGRIAGRRGGQLDPPHRRRRRTGPAPVPPAGQRLGSPAGTGVRRT